MAASDHVGGPTARRRFLESVGLATLGTIAAPAGPAVAAEGARADYLLEPGLVYLNTGSVGPASPRGPRPHRRGVAGRSKPTPSG